ncbi:MAG: aspartyl-phosphate phosphatase Spo0E family protein [Clostridiales bacterium]|nr:aspartyl-phosphate phosphatase Spo0E family protein [Clostridiales bacterium]
MKNALSIEDEIEHIRTRLNLAISQDAKDEDILAISQQLDVVIVKYYNGRKNGYKKDSDVYKSTHR